MTRSFRATVLKAYQGYDCGVRARLPDGRSFEGSMVIRTHAVELDRLMLKRAGIDTAIESEIHCCAIFPSLNFDASIEPIRKIGCRVSRRRLRHARHQPVGGRFP